MSALLLVVDDEPDVAELFRQQFRRDVRADRFHAEGALSIGPPGKLSDIALDLDGTQEAIALKELALKQPKGGLDAEGDQRSEPAEAPVPRGVRSNDPRSGR